MKRLPPYLVRRLLWNPAFLVGTIVLFVAIPVWAIIAAFVSRVVPGRWRPLRVAWFLFVYLFFESVMLVLLFATWVGSGFGWKIRSTRFVNIHYALAAWWLRRVIGSASQTFNLKFHQEAEASTADLDRPVLVFSRHAGPGDSFLLVDAVLNQRDRHPRIILKDLLQLDPVVDVLLNRVPTGFVPSTGRAGDAVVESIAELSAGMGPGDALVLFPEGGNFTPGRHKRAIEKLEEIGRPGLAEQGREMQHLLPLKPTGALKAISSAPTADVVFVGHCGLEKLSTMGDLWRGIPMDSEVVTHLWHFTAEEIPPVAEREQWLYDQWALMDNWIQATLDKSEAHADSGEASQ